MFKNLTENKTIICFLLSCHFYYYSSVADAVGYYQCLLYHYPGYTYHWDKHTTVTRETRLERKRETNCQVQVNDMISVFVIFWSETLPD